MIQAAIPVIVLVLAIVNVALRIWERRMPERAEDSRRAQEDIADILSLLRGAGGINRAYRGD